MALKLRKKESSKNQQDAKGSKDEKKQKRDRASKKTKEPRSAKKGSKKGGKHLCLDLGSYSIKGVVGFIGSTSLKVDAVFEAVLPEGFYENGRMRDKEEFKHILNTALSQNDIKVKEVLVTIDTSELIKREIVFPDIEGVDLEEAITYEIGDHLPIDVNNYILQPRVMARFIEDGQKRQRVLVAALPKDLVEMLFFTLQEVGLRPIALDIHSNAVEKLFNEQYMPSVYRGDKTFVFADLGYKATNVVIVEGQEYRFNRILRFGSSFLDAPYRERLSKESVVDLLETIKQETMRDIGTEMLFSQISAWADDVEKVINYYRSRAADQQIERMLIYGGGSRFRDIDIFFEKRLKIPVVVVDRLDRVEMPSGQQGELFKYINALSALIRR